MEQAKTLKRQTRGSGDAFGELLRIGERVDVSAAASEPAIEFVGEGGGVGDAGEERSVRRGDSADFAERGVELVDVLHAVIGHDDIEDSVAERNGGGVGLDEGAARRGERPFDVEDDGARDVQAGGQTAGATAEIKNSCARVKGLKDLVQAEDSMGERAPILARRKRS